jgi:uncharacterized membrane protein
MAKKNQAPQTKLQRFLPYLLLIGGLLGLLAAFVLTVDKIKILEDPSYVPSCNISPILSCGSVMVTDQASAFGVPNALFGIAGYAVIAAIGAAMLAGAKFKRWFWRWVGLGTLAGVLFVHWLFYQTVYNIGSLCPYCMVVWVVTIPLFWYVLLYNLREGNIAVPKRLNYFLQRHHGDILTVWFLILSGLILNHFWYYWKTLL